MILAIIGPFQILLILLCIGILLLPQIFFLITLQNTIKEVSIENRTIQPSQVWLAFIPLFGIFWQFFMVNRISESIAAEFSKRNITDQSDKPGYSLGLTYCILLCCSIIPGIGPLFGLAGFVVIIIYWVKINDYKNLLRAK
jgi:hypothetical protein